MFVTINNQKFPTEVVEKPEDIMKGMMGRDNLDGCMLFKLKKGYHSFWMKNCLIGLDIVFVNNNKISKIHHNCPPVSDNDENPPSYVGYGDYVIEFPENTASKWKTGDRVSMYLGTPQNPVK